MTGALFYLQWCSFKNRALTRIKRLRQPKYLLFAIVGGLYFYFYFFRHILGRSFRGGAVAPFPAAANPAFWELLGAVLLFLVMFLAWFIPHERAALVFTEAEIAFLFPAPISRRGLIHFKLLRSQLSILITTLFLGLVTRRFAGHFWTGVAAWWLILSTVNLHFMGTSFARTMLLDRGVSNWKRRIAAALFVMTLVGLVVWWARANVPPIPSQSMENLDDVEAYVKQVLLSGPALYVLYPFRLIVRPYLATDTLSFLFAAGPAVVILFLHYWWVVRSDVAFEEASLAASQKLAIKVAAIRSGDWRAAQKPVKAKRAPFRLKATGMQPVALLWKNLLSAGQSFTMRSWLLLVLIAVSVSLALHASLGQSGLLPGIVIAAAVFIVWTVLLGPQVFRHDLRHDLPRADILKMYPMQGWQIVMGELLAPAVIMTGIEWFLLIVAMTLSDNWPGKPLAPSLRAGIGLDVALLVPLLNVITLQIPNGAVLLLPAWFQSGKESPRGIEATGQRIVFMLASLIVFGIVLIPAGLVYASVLFLVKYVSGLGLALPLAGFAAAIVLFLESCLGIMVLGWLFERYDVSAESNP